MRDAPCWVVPHPTRSERPAVRIHRRQADVPAQVVADQQRWRMAPTLSVACARLNKTDTACVNRSAIARGARPLLDLNICMKFVTIILLRASMVSKAR